MECTNPRSRGICCRGLGSPHPTQGSEWYIRLSITAYIICTVIILHVIDGFDLDQPSPPPILQVLGPLCVPADDLNVTDRRQGTDP